MNKASLDALDEIKIQIQDILMLLGDIGLEDETGVYYKNQSGHHLSIARDNIENLIRQLREHDTK